MRSGSERGARDVKRRGGEPVHAARWSRTGTIRYYSAAVPFRCRPARPLVTLSVSRRVQRVKPSPTLAVTARAAKMKAEGHDVISLSVGEPDFDTPAHVSQAGIDAITGGFTRYTNVDGVNELKDAIIAKFVRDNGIQYERPQILVSSGAK